MEVPPVVNITPPPCERDGFLALYRAPEGKPLHISDNPVTLHNSAAPNKLGLSSPGIEIHLPISRSFAICFMCRTAIRLMHQGLVDAAAFERQFGHSPADATPIRSLAQAVASGTPDLLLSENVDHLNSLQVRYSSRFVVSPAENFELAKLMIGKAPRLKAPLGFIIR